MAEQMTGTATTLRPNKRYIATHDANGRSVYADSPDQQFWAVPNVGGVARSYAVSSVPANLTNDADLKAYRSEDGNASHTKRDIVVPDGGANLVVVDIAPGGSSGMHHTVSIDFSICVIGEIEHELDSGEKVLLKAGVSCPYLLAVSAAHIPRTISYKEEPCIDGPMLQKPSLRDLSL
jgi:hypothetical protein